MTDRKRPRQTPSDLASEQVTERLNALYPAAVLFGTDNAEALQVLSLLR